MAFLKIPLVLAGLFVLSGVSAAALIPLIDSSCHGSFIEMGAPRPTGWATGASAEAAAGGNCDRTPDPCPAGDVVAAPGDSEVSSAVVRFEIDNRERPVQARFCLAEPDGTKHIDTTRFIGTRTTLVLDLEVPVGVYHGGFKIEGDRLVSTYHHMDLDDCPDHAIKIPASVAIKFFGGVTEQTSRPQCIDRPPQDPDDPVHPMDAGADEPPLIGPPTAEMFQTGAFVVALASGGILAIVALFRNERLRWMLAFFFTRIRPPQALDHRVRHEIQSLVQAQPGLRPEDIRKALVLGHGQTTHHLRILMQSGNLEALRISGSHHFYPTGRYDHQEKRRLALLNHDAARRLYDTIRKTGEGDVTTLAKESSISVPYASRLAARLTAEGLVARRREGNRIVLFARPERQPGAGPSA